MMLNPCARRLRRTADAVLGYPLMDLYRKAGDGYSEYSQVAFLISCLALAEWAKDVLGIEPAVCCGPSFGEKSAMAYSEVLPFSDVVLLTAQLARCEEEYFQSEHQDVITQSIARTAEPALQGILAEMAGRGEWYDISCHIDRDFFMVSMQAANLDHFLDEVRAVGGLPLYAMWPPMHSSAFAALRRKVANDVLGNFQFADPLLPIIADQDGSIVDTATGAQSMILDSFVRPVRWPDTVQSMKKLGITKIYIAGPDNLFGRVSCTTKSFDVVTVDPRMALRPRTVSK